MEPKSWEVCGHHEGLDRKIEKFKEEVRKDIEELSKEMIEIKILNGKYDERFITLFKKFDDLITWIKAFVVLFASTLVGIAVWVLQKGL